MNRAGAKNMERGGSDHNEGAGSDHNEGAGLPQASRLESDEEMSKKDNKPDPRRFDHIIDELERKKRNKSNTSRRTMDHERTLADCRQANASRLESDEEMSKKDNKPDPRRFDHIIEELERKKRNKSNTSRRTRDHERTLADYRQANVLHPEMSKDKIKNINDNFMLDSSLREKYQLGYVPISTLHDSGKICHWRDKSATLESFIKENVLEQLDSLPDPCKSFETILKEAGVKYKVVENKMGTKFYVAYIFDMLPPLTFGGVGDNPEKAQRGAAIKGITFMVTSST